MYIYVYNWTIEQKYVYKKKLEERVDELIEEKKRIWNKINKYSIVVPKKKKKKN